MDILETILAERRADARRACAAVPLERLAGAAARREHRSLSRRLAQGRPAVIAEMKRASPSAGVLRETYAPAEIARGYAAAGAAGLSVLTEPRHFLGQESDLREVRAAVDLPILRKDFIGDVYQVYETAAWGADAVLLIVAALSDAELERLYQAARGLGLDVLVEAHTLEELRRAAALPEAILGVNSRDLRTLATDLRVARGLAGHVPAGRLSVAESGIRSRSEIEDLAARGYRGFLVGEALMRGGDPALALRELLG